MSKKIGYHQHRNKIHYKSAISIWFKDEDLIEINRYCHQNNLKRAEFIRQVVMREVRRKNDTDSNN